MDNSELWLPSKLHHQLQILPLSDIWTLNLGLRRLKAELKRSGTKSFFSSKIKELNVFAHEVKKMTDMGVRHKKMHWICEVKE